MKTVFAILFTFFSITVYSQIDYSPRPDFISSEKPIKVITWLESAARDCKLSFNHLVSFVDVKDQGLFNSTVFVKIVHNKDTVRKFDFPTGELIQNRIYTFDDLKLKKGDRVQIIFQLNPETLTEKYVFSITNEPLVSKSDAETIYSQKQEKEIKDRKPRVQKTPVVYSSSEKEIRRLRRVRTIGSIVNTILR